MEGVHAHLKVGIKSAEILLHKVFFLSYFFFFLAIASPKELKEYRQPFSLA